VYALPDFVPDILDNKNFRADGSATQGFLHES
jgi:hypothetical protein